MKLKQRNFESEDIEPVINYLVAEDYLSEYRYADSMYRTRMNKGYGQRYIESELSQKGVDETTIAQVANELSIDWLVQVTVVYEKKFGNSFIIDKKDRAKRIRFLQYRGFSMDEIMSVLNSGNV